MHNRQQGIPSEQGHQMVTNLVGPFGTAYRRRSPDDNCQVSFLNDFVNVLEVVRNLPEPYDICQWFSYR